MPTTPIAGSGSSSAPVEITNTYQVGITPLSISAVFDGSGAAGDFIPCVSFYTQNNRLIGRYKGGSTVTAGDTSQQTFAPFLGRTDADGIRFDVDNVGRWLSVEAQGRLPNPRTILITADVGSIELAADDPTFGEISLSSDFIRLDTPGCSLRILSSGETSFTCGGGASWQFADWLLQTEQTEISASVGDVSIVVANGQACVISDHLGNPIFEVRDDGSIHGRAAVGAITWDL